MLEAAVCALGRCSVGFACFPTLGQALSLINNKRLLQWVADVGRSCWLDFSELQLQQGRNPFPTVSALESLLQR